MMEPFYVFKANDIFKRQEQKTPNSMNIYIRIHTTIEPFSSSPKTKGKNQQRDATATRRSYWPFSASSYAWAFSRNTLQLQKSSSSRRAKQSMPGCSGGTEGQHATGSKALAQKPAALEREFWYRREYLRRIICPQLRRWYSVWFPACFGLREVTLTTGQLLTAVLAASTRRTCAICTSRGADERFYDWWRWVMFYASLDRRPDSLNHWNKPLLVRWLLQKLRIRRRTLRAPSGGTFREHGKLYLRAGGIH